MRAVYTTTSVMEYFDELLGGLETAWDGVRGGGDRATLAALQATRLVELATDLLAQMFFCLDGVIMSTPDVRLAIVFSLRYCIDSIVDSMPRVSTLTTSRRCPTHCLCFSFVSATS